MPITRTNFDDVDEADLVELLEVGVPEGLMIEYKRDVYGNSDAEKNEALKDISSFANSSGGHLIIGIAEADGVPTELGGLPGIDLDAEILRLENLLRDGIEPRIVGVRIRRISLATGESALILRIPRSWNPPHRVTARNVNRFYVRHSAGVHETSIEELRHLFLASADIEDRIRAFRADRLQRVAANQGGVPIANEGRLILHIVPFAAFSGGPTVAPQDAYNLRRYFEPIGSAASTPQYNFEGFINIRGGDECHGYTQVFRNGTIEGTKSSVLRERNGTRLIPSGSFGDSIITALTAYTNGLRELGIPAPFVVLLTLTGVEGAVLGLDDRYLLEDAEPIPCDELRLPEISIQEFGTVADCQTAMRPAFDALWNAIGFPQCTLYDDNGLWARDA